MRTINTIWIGKELGPIHTACLRSMLRQGHEVVLHSFGKPADTPNGVKIFDANKLMKQEEIVRHKETNSLTLASDIYRYRILKEGLGLYVDCDFYCIKSFEDKDYVLGWQTDSEINNAVLGAPHDSNFVRRLIEDANNPSFIPPWAPLKKQRKWRFRKLIGFPRLVSTQPWGTVGPILVTHLVKEFNLTDVVDDADFYYPVSWDQLNMFYARGLKVKDLVTPRTVGVHIYNSAIQMNKIRQDSPIFEIINS